jgi:threonine/homoserine/homoserine lactone efflux protein
VPPLTACGERVRSKSAIFGSAFLIGLSGAVMPGPLLTACVGYTLERGFWAGGPLLVLGHALLEGALVLLVLAGLGPLLARRKVGAAIGIVGGAVLLWMGWSMLAWASRGSAGLAEGASGGAPPLHPILAGVLISLANPYWSLWWATIGLKYIAVSRQAGRSGLAAFFCGHQLSDLGCYGFVAGALTWGREAMSAGVYRWLIGVCGGALLGFGLYFVGAALHALLGRGRASPAESSTQADATGG